MHFVLAGVLALWGAVAAQEQLSPREHWAPRSGRVLDAFRGDPVAGASVETWTEGITSVSSGFALVAETSTDAAGRFDVSLERAGVLAEKVRVRAPGYLPFSGVVEELDEVLLYPLPEHTRELRVVDLEGHPIAGAHITTTYSCAHDLSAFEATTDAQGRVHLAQYGLQNHVGQLRIHAAGFAGVEYLGWREVLLPPGGPGPVVALRRRPMLRATLLTSDGAALSERTLRLMDGTGDHVVTTGAAGDFDLDERYDADDFVAFLLGGAKEEFFLAGVLPESRRAVLRPGTPPRDAATDARLVLRTPVQAGDPPLRLVVLHEAGWSSNSNSSGEDELTLPPGRVHVLAGARFRGWSPREFAFELEPGASTEATLEVAREPVLAVHVPPGGPRTLVVEAVTDSIEVRVREPVVSIHVPAHERLLLADGTSAARLATLPASAADREVRLEPPAHQPPAEPERVACEVYVYGTGDTPLAGRLFVRGRGEPGSVELGPGHHRIEAARGEELLVTCRAPGHAHTGLRTVAGEEARLELRPRRD